MAKKAEAQAQNKSNASGLLGFLYGTRDELGKVVWPGRQQLISESVAVILMVILSATLIYIVDNILGWAAGQVFR